MKIVAYYRVSTDKQAYSGLKGKQKKTAKERKQYCGLGLDAQEEAVRNYAAANKGKVIAQYQEAESGKTHAARPKLMEAIAHAQRSKAKLVIAKLDRLSRNLALISALLETGVDFVCCDMPQADRFTIHIYGALAEQEARKISERTREVMAVLKKKGKKLGSARPGHWIDEEGKPIQRGYKEATKRSSELRSSRARAAYQSLIPEMKRLLLNENRSFKDIATAMNDAGHTTTVGKPFTGTAVFRILKREGINYSDRQVV